MGMHPLYEHFPVECRYKQRVCTGYEWRKGWIRRDGSPVAITLHPKTTKTKIPVKLNSDAVEDFLQVPKTTEYRTYDAFETDDLIPSIRRLVESVRRGKNKKTAVKKWVSQYGFMGVNIDAKNDAHPTWESLSDFWREAETLADLWDKYRQVTHRDMRALREWIRFVQLDDDDPFVPPQARTKSDLSSEPGFVSFCRDDIYTSATLEEINRNPLPYYQLAGLRYILGWISMRIKSLELSYAEVIEKIENPQDDIFKIRPLLVPRTLLEAMYLQFYIILSGRNVKICNHCGEPFPLTGKYNKNREYCSETCKLTAKSRRYRERKRLKQV